MLEIKKRNLVFIIVAALITGAAGAGAFLYGTKTFSTEGKVISQKQYDEYKYYKDTYGKLDELKTFVSDNFYVPVKEEDLFEGIYRGLFAGTGDIYSGYYTKEEYESMMASTMGEYSGIGVTISPDEQGYIVVISPTDGTPADRAGIKSGDKIIKVDGTEYTGDTIDMAAAAMRGKEGTKVKVTLIREATGKTETLEIRRQKIINKTVSSRMETEDIGYIRVSSFEQNTGSDFEKEFHSMETKGVKGVIIDLRGNPGGLVDASVAISDLLLPEGTITYTQTQDGERSYYKSAPDKTDLPYVILVDGGSASASEILASAVQDNKGGTLIGTKTFGKGIIQMLEQLEDGDGVKLTCMQYFSPNGTAIQKIGVTPDVIVELQESDYDEDGELTYDRQLVKAVELLNK